MNQLFRQMYLYLLLYYLIWNDQIRHGNAYGKGRVPMVSHPSCLAIY